MEQLESVGKICLLVSAPATSRYVVDLSIPKTGLQWLLVLLLQPFDLLLFLSEPFAILIHTKGVEFTEDFKVIHMKAEYLRQGE